MAYVEGDRSSALKKSDPYFFANVSMWQGALAVHYLTLRTRTQRLCSPSVHQDLWDTTACVSRVSLMPCSLPLLLPPQGKRRGARWSSTSQPRSRHHIKPVLTLWHTALTR